LGYIPTKKFLGIRKVRDIVATKAERLVQEKVDMYMRGLEGSKDVISLLVRANAKEHQKGKMSDAEMNAQIALVYISFLKARILNLRQIIRTCRTYVAATIN
jgi:cytochrome P450